MELFAAILATIQDTALGNNGPSLRERKAGSAFGSEWKQER